MKCDLIVSALANLQCEETPDGSRAVTHCLYPNFEQVAVYIQSHLDGYVVHDGGKCFDLAFDDGISPSTLKAMMHDYAALFGAESDEHRIFARARSAEWLPSVVMSVANASAAVAAAHIMDRHEDRSIDRELREHTYEVLRSAFSKDNVPRSVRQRGRTGKYYTFAFGVTFKDKIALIDTVTPNSISVASRFTSFSAVGARDAGGAFLTHNRPIAKEDSALLAEVADVVPFDTLVRSIERGFQLSSRMQ